MKKKEKKERGLAYNLMIAGVVVFFLVGIIWVIWIMHCSVQNRHFESTVWVFANESKARLAEYHGQKVRVSEDNAIALGTIPMRQKYRVKDKNLTVQDTVTFSFSVHQEMWTMTVERLDKKMCRITLEADTLYQYYFDDNGEFDKYVQIASPEGYVDANKVIESESK